MMDLLIKFAVAAVSAIAVEMVKEFTDSDDS